MRITNQMITNNSLRNMQKSMSRANKATERMESGKKISQASEDPVIAIRALKLRTTVNQLTQYKDKNIPDAESWLKITSTSLSNITKRIEDIQDYCVQGSTDSFNTTDRSAIIDALKELQDMIYNEGNSTYAGRYIFSGYKTERALSFVETEDTTKFSYDITQSFSSDALETKNVLLDRVNYDNTDEYIAGTKIYERPDPEMVYRLNLAYQNISDKDYKGDSVLKIAAVDSSGSNMDLSGFNLSVLEATKADDYYRVGADDIHVIKETGEIIFGENVYNTLKNAADIQVTYGKNEVERGELRPEHYFKCTQHTVMADGSIKDVNYEQPEDGQKIYYEVNFNQSLQVNTEGNKLVSSDISNDINDLIYALTELESAEHTQTKLKAMLEDVQYASNDKAVKQINQMLEDVDVEIAVKKQNMQKIFSANIANFQEYMDRVSAVQSDLGSRMSKLTMINTRVEEQYESFGDLKSSNEDLKSEQAITEFNQAELVYEAALAATSNVITKTLLDYL